MSCSSSSWPMWRLLLLKWKRLREAVGLLQSSLILRRLSAVLRGRAFVGTSSCSVSRLLDPAIPLHGAASLAILSDFDKTSLCGSVSLLRGRAPARFRRRTVSAASATSVFLLSSSDPVASSFTPSYHLVAPILSLSSDTIKNGSAVLFAAEIESFTRSNFFVEHCAADWLCVAQHRSNYPLQCMGLASRVGIPYLALAF